MHRDIARLLVFLAVVRVVTVVACPAPAPPLPRLFHRQADRQLRHQATRRRPAIPRPMCDLSRPSLLPYQGLSTATTPEPLHSRTSVMLCRETAATGWRLVRVVALVAPRPIRTIQLCARTRRVWMLRRAAYHETPTEHDMARSVT